MTPREEEDVYCLCRQPAGEEIMICCDGCDQWYHCHCVEINPEHVDRIDLYYCPPCVSSGGQLTTWKRQCANPACAVLYRSSKVSTLKYCQEQCGLAVAQQRLQLFLNEQQQQQQQQKGAEKKEEEERDVEKERTVDQDILHREEKDSFLQNQMEEDDKDALLQSNPMEEDDKENKFVFERVEKGSDLKAVNASDRERQNRLQSEMNQLEHVLATIEQRRQALIAIVRFADRFSQIWARVGKAETKVKATKQEEDSICGLDQRYLTASFFDFQSTAEEDTSNEVTTEAITEAGTATEYWSDACFQRFYSAAALKEQRKEKWTREELSTEYLPFFVCQQPRFKCSRHYHSQLPKTSSLNSSYSSPVKSPSWAHLQIQSLELEQTSTQDQLNWIRAECERIGRRMVWREESLVRYVLTQKKNQTKEESEGAWSKATFVVAPCGEGNSRWSVETSVTVTYDDDDDDK